MATQRKSTSKNSRTQRAKPRARRKTSKSKKRSASISPLGSFVIGAVLVVAVWGGVKLIQTYPNKFSSKAITAAVDKDLNQFKKLASNQHSSQTKPQANHTKYKSQSHNTSAANKGPAVTLHYWVQVDTYATYQLADGERALLILNGYSNINIKQIPHLKRYVVTLGPYAAHNKALTELRQLHNQYPRSKVIRK